ncbi:MAG: hypothetical protein ACLQVY_13065 [Limisphaerales bacterium]
MFSSMAAAIWASSAYLPSVGPAPLRFRALPLLSANPVSLPAPLPAPPPEPMEGEDDEDSDLLPAIPPLAGTNTDGSPSAVVMEASSAPQNQRPPDPVVSPQMLLQYFQPATNQVMASPTEPVGFQPPLPAKTTGNGPKSAR